MEVRKINKKEVEKTRTIEFVFSDETRDSYGTVIPVSAWDLDRFNKNGIAFFNHSSWSSDPDNAIGSARAWIEDKQLVGSITFEKADVNPKAEKVFRKILAGTYKAVSVGFSPLEKGQYGVGEEAANGSNPTYYYGRSELLEISVVPIPANKNAIARSIGEETREDLKEGEGFYREGAIRQIIVSDEATETDLSDESNRVYGSSMETIIRGFKALGGINN